MMLLPKLLLFILVLFIGSMFVYVCWKLLYTPKKKNQSNSDDFTKVQELKRKRDSLLQNKERLANQVEIRKIDTELEEINKELRKY